MVMTQISYPKKLVIASRESRLAMWQAEYVRDCLKKLYPDCDVSILGMTTRGDQILDRSLSKVGGKGLFIKELEVALVEGKAHIAVHSLKDVPMDLPEGFELACILEREDPRDAWVSPHFESLESLPPGSVVGTSSLRRTVLLQALRPDLQIAALRGNLDTRLRKLDEGQYAGIVLATAGLKRLGLKDRIRQSFSLETMIPAAGQGAIGIEICANRPELANILSKLNDLSTAVRVYAERGVSRTMGGSCSMPLAAHATLSGATLSLRAAWGDPEGSSTLVTAQTVADVGSLEQAEGLGTQVAAELRRGGAH